MDTRNIDGFLPSYLLLEIVKRTSNPLYLKTLMKTVELHNLGLLPGSKFQRLIAEVGAGKGDRKIYDAQNGTMLPGVKARFEGEAETGDKTVNQAYEFVGKVRQFLQEVVNRNSIDGNGMPLIVTVHFDKDYANAFWNDLQMVFGDGDGLLFATFLILDVMGHEFAHGVTSKTSNLIYRGQPGALNEHISDVIGVLCRQWSENLTVKQDSWLVGPGLWTPKVKGVALRSMLEPGTAYNDPEVGEDPQPGHMKDIFTGWEDNQGVHINSGIPNKAFATFCRDSGVLHAWKKPLDIWVATAWGPEHVGERCNFQQFADATVAHCTKLHPQLVDALRAAWDGVGITVKKAA